MSKYSKIRQRILSGNSDKNISENDMNYFLKKIGANLDRINGSHHIYIIEGIPQIIDLQPKDGKIKGYQVGQVRNLVNSYNLGKEEE